MQKLESIPYMEKLSRISRFESHPRKSFFSEIWGRAAPIYDWFQAIRESFLHEILTSYEVFSLKHLLLYGTPLDKEDSKVRV